MEGLGYWIFLAVLYLLSALMKKRQRQTASRQLHEEEPASKPKGKPNPFQAEFLQDLFGDMKEMVREPKEDIVEESVELDDFEIIEQVDPEEIFIPQEHDHVVFEDLSEPGPKPIHDEYRFWKKEKKEIRSFGPLFTNLNDLKRGIVMKEILDKPRAPRRTIR